MIIQTLIPNISKAAIIHTENGLAQTIYAISVCEQLKLKPIVFIKNPKQSKTLAYLCSSNTNPTKPLLVYRMGLFKSSEAMLYKTVILTTGTLIPRLKHPCVKGRLVKMNEKVVLDANMGKEIKKLFPFCTFKIVSKNDQIRNNIKTTTKINKVPFSKTVHQLWLSRYKSATYAPFKYHEAMKSMRNTNKAWKFRFWSNEKIENLIKTHFPSKYSEWLHIPKIIQKCDIARFMIIYVHGGIYTDLDFYGVRPLELLTNVSGNKPVWFFHEPLEHNNKLYNGFFGSVKKHPILLKWINQMFQNIKLGGTVMNTSGPTAFKKFMPTEFTMCLNKTKYVMPFYGRHSLLSKNWDNECFDPVVMTRWCEGSGWKDNDLQLISNTLYPLMRISKPTSPKKKDKNYNIRKKKWLRNKIKIARRKKLQS